MDNGNSKQINDLPLICLVGAGLYGPRWVKPLANLLRLSESTIGRFKRGETVRRKVYQDALAALENRQAVLKDLRVALLEELAR